MKRREVKGKGENERYTHLNAEFQRIVRRDKKASLTDQCKDREKKDLTDKIGLGWSQPPSGGISGLSLGS